MKKILFLLLFLPLLINGCDNDELSKEEYKEMLDKELAELKVISQSLECTDATEWDFIEVGRSICGGPQVYLPYHSSVATNYFFQKIEAYNKASKYYVDKWYKDVACVLIYLPPPTGIECVDGEAKLVFNNGCEKQVYSSLTAYESAEFEYLTLIDITIEGDCLKVTYGSSGCDGSTWHLELFDSEAIMESDPPQRNLRFSFYNQEVCDAYFEKETSFNLSPLKVEGESVILHIDGWDEALLYTY